MNRVHQPRTLVVLGLNNGMDTAGVPGGADFSYERGTCTAAHCLGLDSKLDHTCSTKFVGYGTGSGVVIPTVFPTVGRRAPITHPGLGPLHVPSYRRQRVWHNYPIFSPLQGLLEFKDTHRF